MSVARSLLLFLHGSGNTGTNMKDFLRTMPFQLEDEFCPLTEHLRQRGVDVICPTAPLQRYVAAGGAKMNIWFNRSLHWSEEGLGSVEDTAGTDASLDQVISIIFSLYYCTVYIILLCCLQVLEQVEKMREDFNHIFIGGHSMGNIL